MSKKSKVPKTATKAKKPKNLLKGQNFSAPMKAGLAAVATMPETKLGKIVKLLSRPEGATIDDIASVTDWQKHTVRSAISHTLVKKHGYEVVSDKPKGGQRIYKIAVSQSNKAKAQ